MIKKSIFLLRKSVYMRIFELFWNAIEKALVKLRQCEFYERCSFDARNSLELYVAFNCLDYGTYMTFSEIFNAKQQFNERPNGGRWIAFGHVNFKEFDYTIFHEALKMVFEESGYSEHYKKMMKLK